MLWSVWAGGMDRPSRTKLQPAGSLSSSQPGGPSCWVSTLAFGLIGFSRPLVGDFASLFFTNNCTYFEKEKLFTLTFRFCAKFLFYFVRIPIPVCTVQFVRISRFGTVVEDSLKIKFMLGMELCYLLTYLLTVFEIKKFQQRSHIVIYCHLCSTQCMEIKQNRTSCF